MKQSTGMAAVSMRLATGRSEGLSASRSTKLIDNLKF